MQLQQLVKLAPHALVLGLRSGGLLFEVEPQLRLRAGARRPAAELRRRLALLYEKRTHCAFLDVAQV